MKHFTGYGAYLLFLALRTHFTNAKYDFFQMHGKLRANKESYNKRHDRFFFEKLAKEYNAEELRDFYISNFLEDKHYVTEMIEDGSQRNYIEYQRRRQALSYNFTSELERIFSDSSTGPFITSDSEYPNIINLYLRRILSPETMIILDDFILYSDKFNKYLCDDIIWSKIYLKLRKYKPFLKYDKNKFKHILKEKVNGITTR
jgi:hypothetical protein